MGTGGERFQPAHLGQAEMVSSTARESLGLDSQDAFGWVLETGGRGCGVEGVQGLRGVLDSLCGSQVSLC